MTQMLNIKRVSWIISLIAIIIAITAGPLRAIAQTYTPLEPLPCIQGGGVTCPGGTNGATQPTTDFSTYLQNTFNIIIALSAAAAVFMVVWGGFRYMTTASFTTKASGLETVRKALLGLLLVLCSYLLLRTIDPRLVAIPSTLVTPLSATYKDIPPSEVTTGTQANSGTIYGINSDTITGNISNDQTSQQTLTNQLSTIDQSIATAAGNSSMTPADIATLCSNPQTNPNLTSLCNSRNSTSNLLTSVGNDLSLNQAEAEMGAAVLVCTQTSDSGCFSYIPAKLSAAYAKYQASLNPAQQQQLSGFLLYTQAYASITMEVAAVTQEKPSVAMLAVSGGTAAIMFSQQKQTAINNIKQIVGGYASSQNVDQTLLSQLTAQQNDAVRLINGLGILN